jgi:LSD1 subclass zinc finger protein
LNLGGQPNQGLTLSDVLALIDRVNQNQNAKTDPALTEILRELKGKVEKLEEKVSNPPAPSQKGFIVIRPDGSFHEVEPGKPIIVQPQPPPATTGTSLDELKEQNRHSEEVERIKGEKEYKSSIAETLASIPEKIGEGLAARAAADTETQTAAKTQTAPESMQCDECKTIITIPPGATSVKCPKCNTGYAR